MEALLFPPPVQTIQHSAINKFDIQVQLLRLDLIHPHIGGNKWFKLKYNLEQAKAEGKSTLLTFGGAFSNHILATSAAGKLLGFKTIGIVRGEEVKPLNPILQLAVDNSMSLKYISREQYRNKANADFIESLYKEFGSVYVIPEGGANELGVKGSEEILQTVTEPFDIVCCACGTGTTLAGIIKSLKPGQKAIGFSVLKNGGFIADEVKKYIPEHLTNWSLETGYHFGGYAKATKELEDFISGFYKETAIQLDKVYTGKLLYGVFDLISQGYFKPKTRILIVHSGNKI